MNGTQPQDLELAGAWAKDVSSFIGGLVESILWSSESFDNRNEYTIAMNERRSIEKVSQ